MAKLKSENKDLLLVAFLAKQTPQTKKPCMSSYRTKIYPKTGKPCWILVYSVLLVTLFSGIAVEVMFAGLTALSSGWSVEWVVSPANTNSTYWCLVRASSWHHYIVAIVFSSFRCNNELWWSVLVKTSVVLYYSKLGL